MSDDDEVFRLNSLNRFRKHSKLVLEQHSHCDVPAGCGGAVLQWVSRHASGPLVVQVVAGAVASFLDGAALSQSRVVVGYGEHVLALAISPGARFLLASLSTVNAAGVEVLLPSGLTASNGTWRATNVEPPVDWREMAFDDSAWARLADATLSEHLSASELRGLERLRAVGAVPLGVSGATWVRKRFLMVKA